MMQGARIKACVTNRKALCMMQEANLARLLTVKACARLPLMCT